MPTSQLEEMADHSIARPKDILNSNAWDAQPYGNKLHAAPAFEQAIATWNVPVQLQEIRLALTAPCKK